MCFCTQKHLGSKRISSVFGKVNDGGKKLLVCAACALTDKHTQFFCTRNFFHGKNILLGAFIATQNTTLQSIESTFCILKSTCQSEHKKDKVLRWETNAKFRNARTHLPLRFEMFSEKVLDLEL